MAGEIVNLVMGVARLAAAHRTNAEECEEIKRIAYSAHEDLKAQKGNINNSSRVRAKLDALEESIRRALRLVRACQTRDLKFFEQVLRLYRAEDITNELQQVKQDMLLKWAKANSAIINDHGLAPNANPAGHRPPQLQLERWRPEEHAHRRHQRHYQRPQEHAHQIADRQRPHQQGHHPILPQRERLYQHAPQGPVANAHQRPHQQGHHPILPQRERLYQHAPQGPVANAHQRPMALAHHQMLAHQRPVVQRAHGRPEVRAHGRPEVRARPNRRRHAMPDN